MSGPRHIVILGGGPAGLAAARQLARLGTAEVTLLEKSGAVGGLSGSFELEGIQVDHGSHRLHPACPPEILTDLRDLLGPDLLTRPRNGRIRLRGRWLRFPLKPLDLAFRLPLPFSLGVASDALTRSRARGPGPAGAETFSSVLERGLGKTICRDFYFPYARKIWGAEPDELSPALARRRVGAGSIGKLLRKVLSTVPGFRRRQGGQFLYPRNGFGQICEALAGRAAREGARVILSAEVREIETRPDGFVVRHTGGPDAALPADAVWSTIPLPEFLSCLRPAPPHEILAAAQALEWRALLLVYLVAEERRFSEFDAHYFPEAVFPISRLSEPRNYSGASAPGGLTALCAELPCSVGSPEWRAGDLELGSLVSGALRAAGLRVPQLRRVATRRLPSAYPVHRRGAAERLQEVESWLNEQGGLLSFGRNGLFAHDNLHHGLRLGYEAAACLGPEGRFDRDRWGAALLVFRDSVVED